MNVLLIVTSLFIFSFLLGKADTIHKADLRLTDISNMLGTDWVALAHELEISDSDINIIKSQYPDNAPQQAIVMLRLWMQTSGNKVGTKLLDTICQSVACFFFMSVPHKTSFIYSVTLILLRLLSSAL